MSKQREHEYEIDLVRTYFGYAKVTVKASNQKEAKEKALDMQVDFSGLDGDEPDQVMCIRRLPDPVPESRKFMVEGSDEWEKTANNVARCEVDLYPCQHCGYPTNRGYCCTGCGSDDPDPE